MKWLVNFVKKHKIPAILLTFLTGAVGFLGGFEKAVEYYSNFEEKRALEFRPEEYGVLVCNFDGEDNYKKYPSKDFVNMLNARFRELKLPKAISKHDVYIFSKEIVSSPESANIIGMKYKADIVIWGSVSKEGIQPNIRLVDNSDAFKSYKNKEMTIFKESLYKVNSDKSNRNILYTTRRPELTDEPVALISFVIATQYMNNKNYEKAIEFFWKSIPLEKTSYISNKPTYNLLWQCYFFIGDITNAENIILKRLNYKNDDNLLLLIGIFRHFKSSVPNHLHKKLIDIFINSSPKEWDFLDKLYILGTTEKKSNLSKTRKKDKADKLIESKIQNSQKEELAWKFLEIQLAADEKNIDKFKILQKKIYNDGDLDDRIMLAVLASSLDTKLAFEIIEKIRIDHGDFPSLSLLKSLNYLIVNDTNSAYKSINKHKVLIEKSWIGRIVLSTYYSENSDKEKSSTILDTLISENPEVTLFRKLRADINFYKNKNEFVKEDYKIYSSDHPEDTKVLYRLARLSFMDNDSDAGFRYIRRIYEYPTNDNLNFGELLQSIILKTSPPDGSFFIETKHREKLESVFKLLNKNDPEAASKKLAELTNDAVPIGLSEKYNSFYCYVFAILSLIENEYFSALSFLFEALSEYPTNELKLLINDISDINNKSTSNDKLFNFAKDAYKKMIDQDYNGTANSYENATDEYPLFCYLWKRAGTYRFLAKDKEGAAKNYEKTLLCEPNSKNVHLLYADIMKYDDCIIAIDHYYKSIKIDGETVDSLDGLSQCYEKIGNTTKATEYYKKYKKRYFENGGDPVQWFFYQPLRGL